MSKMDPKNIKIQLIFRPKQGFNLGTQQQLYLKVVVLEIN